MPKNRPNAVDNLLDQPQGSVKALLDRLTKIQTIDKKLHDYLDPAIAKHCRVANIRKSTLVLAVDSPAWSNKIRFTIPELLSHFRSNGFLNLANIDIIVQPKRET
ncbi:MAG: DUF721 domain-containing protein [Kangiellaceae bacterium]|jgi:hypothetical protein